LDPRLVSVRSFEQMESSSKGQIEFVFLDADILNPLWPNRPHEPENLIELRESGLDSRSAQEKIKSLQSTLNLKGVDAHVISDLESIARTLNLRGTDCLPNLLFISYLVVTNQSATLFVDSKKVTEDIKAALGQLVNIKDYQHFTDHLQNHLQSHKVLLDSAETSMHTLRSLHKSCQVTFDKSPCVDIKKIKTKEELKHFEEAHKKDGVALAQAFAWLQKELRTRTVSEFEVGQKLLELRFNQTGFICHSFDPIVGYRQNGAIVHYRADAHSCLALESHGLVLIDSGGHYRDGTTDVTRVLALGEVSSEMIQRYTDVLKGHIAINTIRFPKNIKPSQIDILARQYLYQNGLDYGHGTGHGVGFGTAVHEATDVGLSMGHTSDFVAGSVLSNEPGYYLKDHFGIRIENLIYVVEENGFFRFEQLTLVPYEQKLIDVERLTDQEINWIDQYHQKVMTELEGRVDGEAKTWLKEQCRPLSTSRV
jgi:Xaa-Pro aminopeptidase